MESKEIYFSALNKLLEHMDNAIITGKEQLPGIAAEIIQSAIIIDVSCLVICSIVILSFCKICKICLKEERDLVPFFMIFTIIAFIIGVGISIDLIQAKFAPKYYAIKEIRTLIR